MQKIARIVTRGCWPVRVARASSGCASALEGHDAQSTQSRMFIVMVAIKCHCTVVLCIPDLFQRTYIPVPFDEPAMGIVCAVACRSPESASAIQVPARDIGADSHRR